MALVRFSNELRSDILRNAGNTFDSRIERLRPKLDQSWGDKIYNRLFKDQLEHIKSLDIAWFSTYSNMEIRSVVLSEGNRIGASQAFDFTVARPFPSKGQGFLGQRAAMPSYGNNEFELIGDEWKDYYDELSPLVKEFEQARSDQKVFIEGVRAVIHTHSSLNPALRAWPALWDLVPDYAKEKHREVVTKQTPAERAKASLDEQGVDLDKLTASVTVAKIKGDL